MPIRKQLRALLLTTLTFLLVDSTALGTEVAILGYHEFTRNGSATEMRLPITDFERQMQVLSDQNIKVVSMQDFLAWKRGEKELPEKSVVITIDDGWLSTYTLAYPVLKRFRYPFTVFLYTNYLDSGGRSMTSEMVKEMTAHGCTVGSHSVSHPYPAKVRREKRRGQKAFLKWLKSEMGDSMKILMQKLPADAIVPCYAYPGGFHTKEMDEVGSELGYRAMFNVLPNMVTFDSPDYQLSRFIVLGTHPKSFERALRFQSEASDHSTPKVYPQDNLHITNRLPEIRVEFPESVKVIPDSIRLEISELGPVQCAWDSDSRCTIYQVLSPLRSPSYQVTIEYRVDGLDAPQVLTWTFFIDRELSYTPELKLAEDLSESTLEALPEK